MSQRSRLELSYDMDRYRSLLFVVCSLVVATTSSLRAEMREWTSSDGRKLQAEFVGAVGAGSTARVKLRLANGNEILYPVAKLGEADRVFVKSSLPTDPAALAAEIDRLVMAKLKSSYYELKQELAELPENKYLDHAQKLKRKEEIEREMVMCAPNPLTTDEQFMRRIYLDIAGRIPTYDEASRFLASRQRDKRARLIDELLDTEAFAMRMFNYYSDLLRVREGLTMGGSDMKVDPYIEWLKQCARDDKPFDRMVSEMLTAEGYIWDNPAAGYLITDSGMELCNLSNTFTVFLGTEITCAQCHDHPFEQVKQIDFYRMATFMGTTSSRGKPPVMMMASTDEPEGGKKSKRKGKKKDSGKSEVKRMSEILDAAGMLGNRDTDRTLGDINGTRNYYVNDRGKQTVSLPHDYKYDNGEPHQQLRPAVYFGDPVNVERHASPREAYAQWMTAKTNPRFTINLVNRLWKMAFGYGQIEPVDNIPGHLDGQAQNYELLKFLESLMQDKNFQIKEFFRVVYNTQTYQREAETLTPSLTQVDNGTYHFPGPILRRMTAEQLWDSLVALTTDRPEEIRREGAADYQEFMHFDTSELTTAKQIVAYKERWRSLGSLTKGEGMKLEKGDGRIGKATMVRASEMSLPQKPGHFLRMFGQSDKNLIEGQYDAGSSPQVMALLNGSITNQVLSSPDGYLVNEVAFGEDRKGDKVDKIFLSVLGRTPSAAESQMAASMLNARLDRDAKEKVQRTQLAAGVGDVIWALVNTREFMFIQ